MKNIENAIRLIGDTLAKRNKQGYKIDYIPVLSKNAIIRLFPASKEIQFSDSFLRFDIEMKIEIIKHEMAHIMVYELFGLNVQAHGKQFKLACKCMDAKLNRAYI